MKILFFSGTHFADCSFPLIRSFIELGHDVTCIMNLDPSRCHRTIIDINDQPKEAALIPASKYPDMQVFKDYIDLDKLLFINHPMRYRDVLRTIPLALKVRKFVSRGNFDVVLSDCFFQYAQVLQYLVRVPWISIVHDPIPHVGQNTNHVKFLRFLAFRKADKFILFNKKQSVEFCKLYNINSRRVFYNNLSVYDVYKIFLKKNLSVDDNEILYFGNVSKYKGIEYLCEAMKEVHKVNPHAKLIVAGGGNYHFDKSAYEKLPYITFINRFIQNEEMAELFSRAKIIVCPYVEATQSGVIMTAYAFNKPVIATCVGGLPEMVTNNETGLLVSPRNIAELSDSILHVITDDNEYNKFVHNINAIWREGQKSWNAIAQKYVDIIKTNI